MVRSIVPCAVGVLVLVALFVGGCGAPAGLQVGEDRDDGITPGRGLGASDRLGAMVFEVWPTDQQAPARPMLARRGE